MPTPLVGVGEPGEDLGVVEEAARDFRDARRPHDGVGLLQEVEHGIAKYQWQMRAQLQRTGTDPNTGWDLNDPTRL
jgi:hypothetical protein